MKGWEPEKSFLDEPPSFALLSRCNDAAFAVSFIGDPAVLEARRRMFWAPNLMLNTPTVELEATLPLGAGDTAAYVFLLGNWACAVGGFPSSPVAPLWSVSTVTVLALMPA